MILVIACRCDPCLQLFNMFSCVTFPTIRLVSFFPAVLFHFKPLYFLVLLFILSLLPNLSNALLISFWSKQKFSSQGRIIFHSSGTSQTCSCWTLAFLNTSISHSSSVIVWKLSNLSSFLSYFFWAVSFRLSHIVCTFPLGLGSSFSRDISSSTC